MKAKVFFTDMRAHERNLLQKTEDVLLAAGMKDVVSQGDFVALKIHFGEPGNLAHIRPQYATRVAGMAKKMGAKPFITDTNTLYYGPRDNAVDHIGCALENGFSFATCGVPVIIADGLVGNDYVRVNIEGGKHFRCANIGSAIAHADSMIVMTHFKGHGFTGFGGTIKNLSMGAASRSGKQIVRSMMKPEVNADECTGCGKCAKWCPQGAIMMQETVAGMKAHIDSSKCTSCGECVVMCRPWAIKPDWKARGEELQERIAEYAAGALFGKKDKTIYVAFLFDIGPLCDCSNHNEPPVVRDIGILASRDPVALDMACVDLVNAEQGLPGSVCEGMKPGEDKFRKLCPGTDHMAQIRHAEKIGLGSKDYEIVKV